MGAGDRAGHAPGVDRLVDPHRVLARQPLELSGEERLRREVATVLLADEDDERRPIDARGGQCADRVAETGGRVQDHERRLAASERPAGGHAHHRALVEPEHEAEVIRQVGEQRDLRRPGIGEERREAVLAEHVERGVTDGLAGHDDSLQRNDLIFSPATGTMAVVKVTILGGAGGVGASTAFNLVLTRRPHEIVLVDSRPEMITSHVMDLDQVLELSPGCSVRGGDAGGRARCRRRRAAVGDPDHRRDAARRVPRAERPHRRRARGRTRDVVGRRRRRGHQPGRPAGDATRPAHRPRPQQGRRLHDQRQPAAADRSHEGARGRTGQRRGVGARRARRQGRASVRPRDGGRRPGPPHAGPGTGRGGVLPHLVSDSRRARLRAVVDVDVRPRRRSHGLRLGRRRRALAGIGRARGRVRHRGRRRHGPGDARPRRGRGDPRVGPPAGRARRPAGLGRLRPCGRRERRAGEAME